MNFCSFFLFAIGSYFNRVFCISFYSTELPAIKKFLLSFCVEERAKALEHLPGTCGQIFIDRRFVTVRFVNNNNIKEMPFLKSLPDKTTGEAVFNEVKKYFDDQSIPMNNAI